MKCWCILIWLLYSGMIFRVWALIWELGVGTDLAEVRGGIMCPAEEFRKAKAAVLGGDGWSAEGLRSLRAEEADGGLCSAVVFRKVSGSWIPETVFGCCCLFVSPLFWILLECFVGYFTTSLEYLFMPFVGYFAMPLEYWFLPFWFLFLYSWFIESLNSLPGSWFVFIDEMNTLFGCFGSRLEYEYVVVDSLVSFGGCWVN